MQTSNSKKQKPGVAERKQFFGSSFFETSNTPFNDLRKNALEDIRKAKSYTTEKYPSKTSVPKKERTEPVRIRRSEVLFNSAEAQETKEIRSELQQLIEQTRKELSLLKFQDKALTDDISKLVLQQLPEKPGIYHIRFFQFILKLLKALRKRISDGRMWLEASFEKKKKKKFWNIAKKKGTAFSQSKELSQANLPG